MADVGKIQKTYDLYVDREGTAAAITKGELVCWNYGQANGLVKKTAVDLDLMPPYGVALETCTAAAAVADGILVAWRGVVEVKHDITADDALYKNQGLSVSDATAGCVEAYTTAIAEYLYVGHALEDASSITAEVKIMLAGW